MKDQSTITLAELFDNGAEVDRRVRDAVRAAINDHKRTGDPIAVWHDGQAILLSSEQIEVPDLTAAEGEDFG